MRTTPDQGMDWEMDPRSDRGVGPGLGRSNYRETEPEAPPAESQDLTLGMTALLGIFLAVVLVCAVFFGFGYSTGRTLHGAKIASSQAPAGGSATGTPVAQHDDSPKAQTAAATSAMQENVAPSLTAATSGAKPSAGAPLSADSPVAQNAAAVQASQQAATYPVPFRRSALPVSRPASANAADTPAFPLAATSGVMVQIAAVMRQGDADLLARALRSNGYAATVRTEPQDRFLHVQVGPFATRDQARMMRARLQGDGYNAFLKP